jgi:hypothetical protein
VPFGSIPAAHILSLYDAETLLRGETGEPEKYIPLPRGPSECLAWPWRIGNRMTLHCGGLTVPTGLWVLLLFVQQAGAESLPGVPFRRGGGPVCQMRSSSAARGQAN